VVSAIRAIYVLLSITIIKNGAALLIELIPTIVTEK